MIKIPVWIWRIIKFIQKSILTKSRGFQIPSHSSINKASFWILITPIDWCCVITPSTAPRVHNSRRPCWARRTPSRAKYSGWARPQWKTSRIVWPDTCQFWNILFWMFPGSCVYVCRHVSSKWVYWSIRIRACMVCLYVDAAITWVVYPVEKM